MMNLLLLRKVTANPIEHKVIELWGEFGSRCIAHKMLGQVVAANFAGQNGRAYGRVVIDHDEIELVEARASLAVMLVQTPHKAWLDEMPALEHAAHAHYGQAVWHV